MKHLSKNELSEVAAQSFVEYQEESKAWLLVAPDNNMWASSNPEDLIKILNKRNENDLPIYQEA